MCLILVKGNAASLDSGVNLLVFDTLAAGGFLLTSHCQELTDLFHVGEHLDSFQTPEELRTKVDFYLKNPQIRDQIAVAGHQAALANHTWQHRAGTLLATVSTSIQPISSKSDG